MNAGETIFVQGRSGVIIKMDVPAEKHRRERFDADLAKGALRLVDDDDVDEVPHPRWPDATRFVLRNGARPVDPPPTSEPTSEPTGEPAGETGSEPTTVEQPKKSAGKPDWVEFAVSKGMEREAAESMTKADLVDQFGS